MLQRTPLSILFAGLLLFSFAPGAVAQCTGGSGPPPPGSTPWLNDLVGLKTGPASPTTPTTPTTPTNPTTPTTPTTPTGTTPQSGPIAVTPRMPVAPGARAAAGSVTGAGIRVERAWTSKEQMQIAWNHPVYTELAALTGEEAAAESEEDRVLRVLSKGGPLPKEKVFDYVTGDDARPILVLRECDWCRGTDFALLRWQEDNEKTLVLSRWFNCIKVGPDVLHPEHPFRNMFPEEHAPHLFMANADGSNYTALNGELSRSELWKSMTRILKDSYRKDPEKAMRNIMNVFAKYDALDPMILRAEQDLDMALAERGGKSKVKKIEKEIAKLKQRKAEAMEKEKEFSELGLLAKKK